LAASTSGLVEGGGHLRLRVVGADDLQLGVLGDVVLEPAHAADLGADAGDVGHDGDLALLADLGDQGLGAVLTGRLVVRGQEGLVVGLAGVGEHRVQDDDRDLGLPGLLHGGDEGLGIRGREHDGGELAVDRVLDHGDLVGDVRLRRRALERHRVALELGQLDGVGRALVHVLPEVGVGGLDDDGDLAARGQRGVREQRHRRQDDSGQCLLHGTFLSIGDT
jgi:hypothetical protein